MTNLMIASDIHGSAYYCKKMLEAFDREQADRLLILGCQIKYRYSHSFSAIPIAICSLVIGSSRNHRPVAL